MNTVCDRDMCSGCYACYNSCNKDAIMIIDSIKSFNAIIDSQKCINCGKCFAICPVNNEIPAIEPLLWLEGCADPEIRRKSSSGGLATKIAIDYANSGGYVCSCLLINGSFQFSITNDLNIIRKFAGSKYVKSSIKNVLDDIKVLLSNNQRLLFIGLPCQVAAVKRITNDNPLLTTIDLLCHGTPSKSVLDAYLKDNNINLNNVSDIKFREKNDFGLIVDMIRLAPNRVVDFYTLAYLAGLDYTENCYHCPFAKSDRISDITLGDSWSATPEKQKSGISLILCQTQKGIDLVAQSKLDLEKVNPQLAKKTNHQLVSPSIPHLKRNYFIDALIRGKKFSTAFIIAMPKDAAKQIIKWILTIIHIL